ncbi:MAG: molybdate ABC transporter substrate-binding protein [Tepidisphaeraceae bacterium]
MLLRAIALSLTLAASTLADTIRVGAAISLKDAFDAIAKKYEAETGEHVEFSFGSSGQVMAQIKSGAGIDVFVSAATQQVEQLTKEKLVDASTSRVVAGNQLVLIVPADAKTPPKDFAELAASSVEKIAAGEPKTVPAGQYAKQVFQSLKIESAVANKIVYGTNVRQVLAYVERGEVQAGLVYATDARQSGEKVKIVATAAAGTHEPIVYPGVVIANTTHAPAALKFLDYLATPAAKAELTAKGFSVDDLAPAKQPAVQ